MKRRPFLKWAGNKFRIIERIKLMLPEGERLIEPFLGSAAVFLNTNYKYNILADNNPDLVALYKILQSEGTLFIDFCRDFFQAVNNSPERFYAFRELFNKTSDERLKAALFLYLNRHGYNGLCRYNTCGAYNVPFGRYKKPYFPETEMKLFHAKSQGAQFIVSDFVQTIALAQEGDIIYADPPYVQLSATANFTSYSQGGFSLQQQKQLAELVSQAAERGVKVLISNHATDFTLQIYARAKIECFPVQRFISSDGTNRGKAAELLALFGS